MSPLLVRNLRYALFTTLLLAGLAACDAVSSALPQPAAQITVSLPDEEGENSQSALEDAVLYGEAAITVRLVGALEASFYLDDEAASSEPASQATTSPFTLAFDTRTLPDGPHTLTLNIVMESGEQRLVHTPFRVGNAAFEMLGRVNDLRAGGYDCGKGGVFGAAPVLRLESRLMVAAQRQADDLDENTFLEHTGSDGSTVASRVSEAGYSWSRVGENLASGQDRVAEVVADWAASDAHCANLMNPVFTELGVGHAGSYWAQVLARPE